MNAFDDDPGPVHSERCAALHSNDPCSCGAALIEDRVQELLATFARYERPEAAP